MFVVVAGRGQGKTQAIVNWWLEDPQKRIVLVSDSHRREHLADRIGEACNYSMRKRDVWESIFVVSHDLVEYLRGSFRFGSRTQVAIDNAEEILATVFHAPVELLTFNATLIAPPSTAPNDYIDGEEVPRWSEEDVHALDAARYMIEGMKGNKDER